MIESNLLATLDTSRRIDGPKLFIFLRAKGESFLASLHSHFHVGRGINYHIIASMPTACSRVFIAVSFSQQARKAFTKLMPKNRGGSSGIFDTIRQGVSPNRPSSPPP
jgi:hypothetical protein